ncbi:MAG: hypothetical protein ACLUPK_04220 [Veillonella sp.]
MKKSILKSSIALAVAGVFGATVAVTAAEQATPVPVTQEGSSYYSSCRRTCYSSSSSYHSSDSSS